MTERGGSGRARVITSAVRRTATVAAKLTKRKKEAGSCLSQARLAELTRALDAALSAKEPTTRVLEVVAVIGEAISDLGIRPVVVGGLAVTYWTKEAYVSLEADLLLPMTDEVVERLEALGFIARGRHWRIPGTDVELEAPGDWLSERQLTKSVRLPSGREVLVLSAEEMYLERLREFIEWGGHSEPFRQMLYLTRATDFDRAKLRARARDEGFEAALDAIEEIERKIETETEPKREFEPFDLEALAKRLRREMRS